jgi:hypothetical protein
MVSVYIGLQLSWMNVTSSGHGCAFRESMPKAKVWIGKVFGMKFVVGACVRFNKILGFWRECGP